MAQKPFSDEERRYLASLPAVASVEGDTIRYAPAFRRECMERYDLGEAPTKIFREAGLDPDLIGRKRIERSIARWRKAAGRAAAAAGAVAGDSADAVGDVHARHVAALRQLRRENRQLESRVIALEGLVELSDARSLASSRKSSRYELLERLRQEHPDLAVKAACDAFGVSEGGYYLWRNTRAAERAGAVASGGADAVAREGADADAGMRCGTGAVERADSAA